MGWLSSLSEWWNRQPPPPVTVVDPAFGPLSLDFERMWLREDDGFEFLPGLPTIGLIFSGTHRSRRRRELGRHRI